MKCDTDDDVSFAPHLLESHDKSSEDDTNDGDKTEKWKDYGPGG